MRAERHRRSTLHMVIVVGNGRHSLSLRIPRWSLHVPTLLTLGLAALSLWLGFQLQGVYGASGARISSMSPTPQLSALVHAMRMVDFEEPGQPSFGGAREAAERARSLGLGTLRAGTALLGGRPEPAWVLAADSFARRSETLAWPVADGWFTRGYGSGTDGYHLAMDIMAPTGSDVRAAGDAIVGYADDEIRGYGNIVMLIHAGGAITAYAHNSVNHVRAGQVVKRGELIAHVGSTGISRGPHVHFELMVDGKNCDPTSLFRPGVPHRDGKSVQVTPQRWDNVTERPPVRCERRRRHPNSRYVHHEDDGDELSALSPR